MESKRVSLINIQILFFKRAMSMEMKYRDQLRIK
jgi:hypothetical protein